jgi:hypothetical protein
MDEDAAVALEQAITDAATLLLRVDKYRRGREADVAGIRRAVADVGARARRAHRAATGGEAMAGLRDEARSLAVTLEEIVAEVLGSRPYREAVAAYGREDVATLRPLLFGIFTDLSDGPTSGGIFAPIDWSGRRGPRPPEDVVTAVDAVREEGFPASGDSLDPGVDPDLPAVTFGTGWPDGAPVALACRAERLGTPSVLGPAGEVLVHQPRLRVEFEVVFQLARDRVDEWVEDPARYRSALAPLLEGRGHVTRSVPTPAAP